MFWKPAASPWKAPQKISPTIRGLRKHTWANKGAQASLRAIFPADFNETVSRRSSLESSIQISCRQHLTRSLSIPVATDPSRRVQEFQIKLQPSIQRDYTLGCLIGKQYRSGMLC